MRPAIVPLFLIILVSGCVQDTGTLPGNATEQFRQPDGSGTDQESPPVLYGIGIDLAPLDPATNLAGDVYFQDLGYDDKMFLWFGMDYGDGSLNPHPMFVLPLGTEIHAVSDGTVQWIETLGDNDYDVCVYRHEGDPWCVSYEHISSPRVSEGDTVKTGDVVGEAGRINDFVEFGKFDLKVWRGGLTILNYCPYELLHESVRQEKQAGITRFIRDWEEFMGRDIYPEDEWLSPGCAVETLEEHT